MKRFTKSHPFRVSSLSFVLSVALVPLIAISTANTAGAESYESQESAPGSAWEMTATAERRGDRIEIRSAWTPPSGITGTYILDIEVRNSSGERVLQRYEYRYFSSRDPLNLEHSEQLSAFEDGDYVVSQGVFNMGWGESLFWNRSSATFSVDASKAPETTTTTRPDPVPQAPKPQAPKPPAAKAPRSQASFYGVNKDAAEVADQWKDSRPGDAALMDRMAHTPTATWLGDWTKDVHQDAAEIVEAASKEGKEAVIVAYNIPGRDCGSYSSGGAGSEAEYNKWIHQLSQGIGDGRATVIVEPDALSQLCGDVAARYRMLRMAVDELAKGSNTRTYLDAGHGKWVGAQEMATRLRSAGVENARGFALNVSNFQSTVENLAHGEALAALLGGKSYVIDTSRNGNGPNGEWCNPRGRSLGALPTTSTGAPHADAYLWIKTPGASDGNCNGGPRAGEFWPEYGLSLARAAWG